MSVNVLARAALVSTGAAALLRAADEAAWRGNAVDDIAIAVSTALRRRVGAVAHDLTRRDQHWLCGQTAVLVGWSDQAGRMVAFTLGGSAFFEPVLASRLALPQPEGVRMPGSMPELVAYARKQVAALRESLPDACGGSLQVAELRADRITSWVVPDFDVGQSAVVASERFSEAE